LAILKNRVLMLLIAFLPLKSRVFLDHKVVTSNRKMGMFLGVVFLTLQSFHSCSSYSVNRYTLAQTAPAVKTFPRTTVFEAHDSLKSLKTFSFLGGLAGQRDEIKVQEVPFTGAGVGHELWPVSIALSLYMWGLRNGDTSSGTGLLKDRKCIELGAGVGLPGLMAAQLLDPASMTLTDSRSLILENLANQLSLMPPPQRVGVDISVAELNWQHVYQKDLGLASLKDSGKLGNEEAASVSPESSDMIIASDVIYYAPDVKPLAHTLMKLLKPGGCAVVFGPKKRVALNDFANELRRNERCESVEITEFDFLVERLVTGVEDELDSLEMFSPKGGNSGGNNLDVFASEEPLAYAVGEGTVPLPGGRGDLHVQDEDILFRDSNGAWIDARVWDANGENNGGEPPIQKVLCIRVTKKK